MKQLLIEEMKRAVQIMEGKDELKRKKIIPGGWTDVDKETVELCQILHSIRRHSVLLEKEID